MNKRSRFKTLREFIDAQPRSKTQGAIAKELGVSESALSSYLSGARFPSREIALRLSAQCGIPLESLLSPDLRPAAKAS